MLAGRLVPLAARAREAATPGAAVAAARAEALAARLQAHATRAEAARHALADEMGGARRGAWRAAPPRETPGASAATDAARKTRLALDALWAVRKGLRKVPAEAVERLAAVALDGVDANVAEQVYGEWLRQCCRLARERRLCAYKYHAAFGRGAVLVPEPLAGSSRLEVVSALGLPAWRPGTLVPRGAMEGLRPLR